MRSPRTMPSHERMHTPYLHHAGEDTPRDLYNSSPPPWGSAMHHRGTWRVMARGMATGTPGLHEIELLYKPARKHHKHKT